MSAHKYIEMLKVQRYIAYDLEWPNELELYLLKLINAKQK